MNKRLAMLEHLTQSGQGDAFAWYGLAMEYRKAAQTEAAISTFEALRTRFPDYLPQYLMCGQTLLEAGKLAQAREWLETGSAVARAQGNTKTLSELEDALEGLAR